MLPGAVVRAAMAVVPGRRVRVGAAAGARRACVRAAHGRARPPRPPPPHPLRVRAVSLSRLQTFTAVPSPAVVEASRRRQLRLPNISVGLYIHVLLLVVVKSKLFQRRMSVLECYLQQYCELCGYESASDVKCSV